MKLNRKGFTLVELLVTIVIVSLVVGLSVFGIVSLINNSKEKTKILSVDNVKEAARIYSAEASSNSWKNNGDYDAFCVTISELMNKGLLDKKASINDGYTRDSFVVVKRNKVTLAIDNVEMVSDDINEEYNKVCTGQVLEEEDYERPAIEEETSYTDRIEIPFTVGRAESGIKNYTCLYGESSSSVNREGVIEDNKCILDGLKNNKEYYVLIYMNTNKGSSILADGSNEYNTKDFADTTFIPNNNTLIVKYNKSNINGDGYYYFKSDVDTRSLSKIEMCTLNDNQFNCTDSDSDVKSGVWYRTINSNVKLVYSSDADSFDINTKICDKSNNCHDNSETINIYNVKFYRNGAVKIDGTTNEYVEGYCLAIDGSSCSVTSPSITPKTGYSVVGWNTSSSATTSSWDVGTTKNIDSDMKYYAITRPNNKVNIKYSVNGGSIATSSNANGSWTTDSGGIIYKNGSSEFETINYGEALGSDGLANYNNSNWINISKTGYSAVAGEEWICLSDNCVSDTYNMATVYNASDFCGASSGDCTVVLGVNWVSSEDYIDLNWIIDGQMNYSCPDTDNLKAGLKVNGVDRGYVSDYWTLWEYGTSWEIYGLKLNGTNISYSASGTIGEGGASINIRVNTLGISVNNSTYGSVSSSSLYVKPNTTYSTNSNKLTLGDGRSVTATAKTVSGYTTSFSSWSSTSGTISSATSITANFTATVSATPVDYTRFTYNSSNEITVYHFNSFNASTSVYSYDKKNGLSSSGDLSGTVYTKDELASKKIHFVRFLTNELNCYYGASTSSGVYKTFPLCYDLDGDGIKSNNEVSIWKTTASGWYYSKTYDCFVQSSNLSINKTTTCYGN